MNFAQGVDVVITKESLIRAQESTNEALLKVKQKYSNSPSDTKIFFIVEGKDDVPFYGTKAEEYLPDGWTTVIIEAKNRKKVIATYENLDWSIYAKEKILFFVDRDLSDYTNEETPNDSNVYVTSKYAIENELCSFDTYIKTIRYYFNMADLDEDDEEELRSFFFGCWLEFVKIAEPIMAQILFWKINEIKSNYSNFKMQHIFSIADGTLRVNPAYHTEDDVLKELFIQSGVTYSHEDLLVYKELLNAKHTPDEYIRGKFVLTFFAKILMYTSKNSEVILSSKKKAKDLLGIGYESVVLKLCGIMKRPESLAEFFDNMKTRLVCETDCLACSY